MNNARPLARSQQRTNVRSPVRRVSSTTLLERSALAAARAAGYAFTGQSILQSAKGNPRAAQFVAIAAAVLAVVQSSEAP